MFILRHFCTPVNSRRLYKSVMKLTQNPYHSVIPLFMADQTDRLIGLAIMCSNCRKEHTRNDFNQPVMLLGYQFFEVIVTLDLHFITPIENFCG